MEELLKKGFLKLIRLRHRNYYKSIGPKRLLKSWKNNLDMLENIVPGLEEMVKESKSKPRVEFYEGIEGIKKIYTEYYPKISYYFGILALIISVSPLFLWLFWITKNFVLFFIVPIGISCVAIAYGFISLGFTTDYREKSKIGIILGLISIILFFFWYLLIFY